MSRITYSDHSLRDIITYIENNLINPLSIPELCAMSSYSLRQFQTKFQQEFGMPIGQYIRHRRLSRTASYLKLTSESITDISTLYQYESPQYYSRAFTKFFGVTPSEFRSTPINFNSHVTSKLDIFRDSYFIQQCVMPSQHIHGEEYFLKVDLTDPSTTIDASRLALLRVRKSLHLGAFTNSSIRTVIDFRHHGLHSSPVLRVKYFVENNCKNSNSITVDGGLYAKITFIGTLEEYEGFSYKIYTHILPKHNLTRRTGADFEMFKFSIGDVNVMCNYFIPINPTH